MLILGPTSSIAWEAGAGLGDCRATTHLPVLSDATKANRLPTAPSLWGAPGPHPCLILPPTGQPELKATTSHWGHWLLCSLPPSLWAGSGSVEVRGLRSHKTYRILALNLTVCITSGRSLTLSDYGMLISKCGHFLASRGIRWAITDKVFCSLKREAQVSVLVTYDSTWTWMLCRQKGKLPHDIPLVPWPISP